MDKVEIGRMLRRLTQADGLSGAEERVGGVVSELAQAVCCRSAGQPRWAASSLTSPGPGADRSRRRSAGKPGARRRSVPPALPLAGSCWRLTWTRSA